MFFLKNIIINVMKYYTTLPSYIYLSFACIATLYSPYNIINIYTNLKLLYVWYDFRFGTDSDATTRSSKSET